MQSANTITNRSRFNFGPVESLQLPKDFELVQQLSCGFRSTVYKAEYQGEHVVLKVYKPEYDDKCRRRVGKSAAQFEYERNQQFYRNAAVRPYVARPIRWLKASDGWTGSFVQEYLDGLSLSAFRQQIGELSIGFAQQVERICKVAWSEHLFDLDLHNQNVLAVRRNGGWRPFLFDFNMMPKDVSSSFLTRVMFQLGLRDPAYRDRRWLKQLFDRKLTQTILESPSSDDSQIFVGRFASGA
jgi:hypothetical protein